MTTSYKKHNDIEYIYFDGRNKSDLALFEEAIRLNKYIEAADDHSIRIIIDVTNLNISFKAYFSIREVAKKAQKKILFSAFVGMTKHTKVIFQLYKRFTNSKIKLFNNLNSALEYVTQENDDINSKHKEEDKKAS